jgi:hypothetical protein
LIIGSVVVDYSELGKRKKPLEASAMTPPELLSLLLRMMVVELPNLLP